MANDLRETRIGGRELFKGDFLHAFRDDVHAEVSPAATWDPTARRDWSSMSWKITHSRPPVSTYPVASSCQHALGAG